jgi:hypothetical protein
MRGLAITLTAIKHTSYNPVSSSAGLMYNPAALDVLTPTAFERIRLLMGVNKWTG